MTTLFIVLTAIIALATVLPLFNFTHWIVRGFDFPRFQIAVFSFVLLLAIFICMDIQTPVTLVLISVTTLCLIWQLWWILPYTPLSSKEVKKSQEDNPDQKLNIITSNVLTPNRNAETLVKLVKQYQPDILVTLESDSWWEQQLEVLESTMPYTVKCPLDNLYGMHLYSKLPLHDSEISYIVEEDIPSIHTSIEMKTGQKVQAHFIHPAPPSPSENTKSAERDAELVVVAKKVAEQRQPIIVAGDLNDVAWSKTTRLFRKISGLLDPRIGRGMFNTFNAKLPILRWPLDHLFHSTHFTLCTIKRLPSIGSDHFPLFTSLALNPERHTEQDGIEPDGKDVEEAEEMAAEEGVNKEDVPEN